MEAKNFIAVTGCVLLAACAVHPMKSTAVAQMSNEAVAEADVDRDSDAPPPVNRALLPNQELTARVLYQLLLAEIAGQRDHPQLAASTYLDVAKSTRDPRIAQRATEVALSARQPKVGIEAAQLWANLDPTSVQARQTVLALLVTDGRFNDAKPWLDKLMTGADAAAQGQVFLHLNSLLARQTDKAGVLAFVQGIAAPYPKLAEAHYSTGLAAFNAGRKDLALTEVHRASEIRPGWEASAIMEGQILQTEAPDKAVTFYRDFLKRYPQSREVQLNFARFLVDRKDFTAAREQFGQILKATPDNPELTLAVGLLSMQLQDYDGAEDYLERVLELNYKDPDAVRMYLGQLNEERKDFENAAKWYKAVQPGDQYIPAQVKVATMLARQNQIKDARDYLSSVKVENNQQRVQVIIAESQILRDAKQYQEAYDTLSRGLVQMPDTADLLYDRAMVAERLERLDLLEADLRKVIKLKPDHAHAYNALGYTLADRTTRFGEAKELIEKAIALSPSDPFIIDSLGWVQYRMGNLTDATTNLKSAYEKQPDPEIAAHLGEVLWAQGQKDEARRILQGKLKDNPDNEVLQAVIKKFNP